MQLPSGAQWRSFSPNEKVLELYRLARADVTGAAELLEQMLEVRRQNPLQFFEPHPAKEGRRPQMEFIQARTPVVAAFAATRFGKSTVLGVCGLREALPREVLPAFLAASKRFDGPTKGWIMLPTLAKIEDSFRPVFEKWTPPSEFFKGSWDTAFNGASYTLRFACGSSIAFKTYEQPSSTLGGAALHWVGYDEPPPKKHREEGMWRLADHGGYEMFAMTPLDTNTAYIRKEIFRKRESPDITVVSGSIHENPTLDKATVERAIGATTDIYRRAREFGEFVNVGGMIYPDFARCVLPEDHPLIVWRDGRFMFDPAFIRTLDIVIGIDPGIRNAGFSWVGFDRDLTAYVFDEALLQDSGAKEYVDEIREINSRWGIKDPAYVIDPAAKQRAQVNGMTVLSAINQEGIYPNLGQNDHELGFDQMRARMGFGRFKVAPSCVGLRDEADDYEAKEPKEGQDNSHLEPIEVNAHRLASLRYAVLERFWDQQMEADAPDRNLGWVPGENVPPASSFRVGHEVGPMGAMS